MQDVAILKNVAKDNLKALCLCALLLFSGFWLTAQNDEPEKIKVDYDKIEKFVKKNEDDFEALMARFVAGDTTLSTKEMANLYYGTYFSPKYSYLDASKEMRDAYGQGDAKKGYQIGKEELKKSPTSLGLLLLTSNCAAALKLQDEAKNLDLRVSQILDVIFASGDGQTCGTAWKVLEVSDEYIIIYGVFGAKSKSQALVHDDGHSCDKMTVFTDDPNDTIDIYFDITLHMKKLNEMFNIDTPKDDKPKKQGKKKKMNQ